MRYTRALATLSRSWQLLRAFPQEQTNPAAFYGPLAEDTAELIGRLAHDAGLALRGSCVLDVGGGPGYFAAAFDRRGARYIGLEPDAGEISAAGLKPANSIRGDGTRMPFADGTFDVVYSSNVAEHVPDPEALAEEMLRVTRPGGLVVLSYTVWLGPFGGHETGLWQHYVGGAFARDYYTRRHGHPPKNVFGTSLFAVSCARGLRWAENAQKHGNAELLLAFPRYHPRWAWWLTRVPGVREFLVSNLVLVLRAST